MAGKGSYYEDYMRSSAMLKHGGDRNAKQLLTDRNAYISFLEVQLERVSAACMSAQTFEKRLAEVEASQIATEQKISSLSKVFRLNQEYMDQTTEQARAELSSFANKMDAWMDKYSVELQAHQARITQSEEHLRRLDEHFQVTSDELQRDLSLTKEKEESEVQELKTLLFAVETRLEGMQNAQGDAEHHMDLLRHLVSDRLNEDLERIRATFSGKFIAMEEKHEQLREKLKTFAIDMESSWKTDLARMNYTNDDQLKGLHLRLDRMEHDSVSELHEVKEFLRKCLDAQHLLSATVVGLQSDVDGRKMCQAKATTEHTSQLTELIDELQANQHRLKDALRIVQSCSREAERRSEMQHEQLADRIDAAEMKFAKATKDTLDKADEMRMKVLVALGEVELKLRHDAAAVAEDAVQSVRSESTVHITQLLETTTRLEARLDDVEDSVRRIEVHTPRIRVPTGRLAEDLSLPEKIEDNQNTIAQLASTVARNLQEHFSTMITVAKAGVSERDSQDARVEEHIKQLEKRLERRILHAEERSALLPQQFSKRLSRTDHREHQGSLASSGSSAGHSLSDRVSTKTPSTSALRTQLRSREQNKMNVTKAKKLDAKGDRLRKVPQK